MSSYYENPSKVLDACTARDKGEPRLHGSIEHIVGEICQGNWSKRNASITMEPITGGISNILYLVTLNPNAIESIAEEKVVVRLFGLGTEKFTDRAVENAIFAALSKKCQAPKFLGLFSDGRVEGHLDARPLEPDEFVDETIYPKLARAVADMHALPLHYDIDQMDNKFCWQKISVFFSLAKQVGEFSFVKDPIKAAKFDDLNLPKMKKTFLAFQDFVLKKAKESRENFVRLNEHVTFDSSSNSSSDELDSRASEETDPDGGVRRGGKRRKIIGEGKCKHREDLMRALGSELAYQSVFCHNDLLSGNCLYQLNKSISPDRNPGDITIIDYEYGGYNFRAFDIANHFNEYAGFDFSKIPEKFPKRDARHKFICEYLNHTLNLDNFHDVNGTILPKDAYQKLADVYGLDIGGSHEDQRLIIESFDEVVLIFTLLSHLLWGSWSSCQAGMSSIDFDFLEYAKLRFEFFHYHKNLFKIEFES